MSSLADTANKQTDWDKLLKPPDISWLEADQYQSSVRSAIASIPIVTRDWMSPVRRSIAKHQPLDEATAELLTGQARMLMSFNAPMLKLEAPELFAFWNKTMRLIDQAEAAGLYQPPKDLGQMLTIWRGFRDIDAARAAAPWVDGPTQVSIDPNIAPVVIPAGIRFLPDKAYASLQAQENAIRERTATAVAPGRARPAKPDLPPVHLIAAADDAWSMSLAVVNRGRMTLDEGLKRQSEHLLRLIKSRLNPASKMKFEETGKYSEENVRWLIEPQADVATHTVRWAVTNGAVSRPLGIAYAEMKFGATQQILLSANHWRVADVLARPEINPASSAQSIYLPENHLAEIRRQIAPLLASLEFLPGHRYADAGPDAPRNPNSMEFLIAGGPGKMERTMTAARAIDEQSFWQRLQDDRLLRTKGIPLLFLVAAGAVAMLARKFRQGMSESTIDERPRD